MAAFALEVFERRAEGYWQARAWREWQYQSGQRPGRGLVTLYQEDFPDFTSKDLWDDLNGADVDEAKRQRALTSLLAAASLEGRTREFASRAAGFPVRNTITFEDEDIVWREVPARYVVLGDVPRRHALAEAWRGALLSELNPVLAHWHEALRRELSTLGGGENWLAFWAAQHGLDASEVARLAQSVLETSQDVYGHALGVYLAQVGLPIDDAWSADLDWAFRAPRFDTVFGERERMPTLKRTLGDLGIDFETQSGLHFEAGPVPWLRYCPVGVPQEAHVLLRLAGGYEDYSRSLRGVAMAEHAMHTDVTLPFWQRCLGNETATLGYGALLEGLTRDRAWLIAQREYESSDDYRVIATLRWLYGVRKAAASVLYEQQLWQSEPGGALAADYEVRMSEALRIHCFADESLLPVLDAPWSTLSSAVRLRAEVFAAQLRAFLVREFDEEWWRSTRAARFIVQELWRIGRRHTPEELLGFMGYEGFDAGILWAEMAEVLSPL